MGLAPLLLAMTAVASLLHRRKRHRDASLLPGSHFHGPQRHRRLRLRLGLCPGPSRFPSFASPSIPPEAGSPADMGNYLSGLLGPRDEGLVVYRRWVDAKGLTLVTTADAELGPAVVSRRIRDPRKAALKVKSEPYYKKALAEARSHDKRLGEINLQVDLLEEGLAELRKSAEAPKQDLSELFSPLTAEEENEVHRCLYGRGSSCEVLALHEPSNFEVSREKFRCLRPRGWLNDEVINLYLELLKEREKREPKRFLKCHFFNTFFYKKLACGRNGYDYKSVKRWTAQSRLGYELIECDKIFVPIHKDIHWCLGIINMKEKMFQYLDSLGAVDHHVSKILARYIAEEVKEKSNKEINTSSWHEELIDIPLQENGFDCGMFMLKYIDFHSRGLSLSFSQENMDYFRKRTVKEILRLRAD